MSNQFKGVTIDDFKELLCKSAWDMRHGSDDYDTACNDYLASAFVLRRKAGMTNGEIIRLAENHIKARTLVENYIDERRESEVKE